MNTRLYQFEQLLPLHYPLVNKFYKNTGYGGRAGRDELVYILREASAIVAAVRLQPKPDGWLFLRAMCVAPELRGQGAGRQLLRGLNELLTSRPVYCYPFEHLIRFYAAAGFQRVNDERLPEGKPAPGPVTPHFMTEALQRYRQQGRKVCLMVHATGLPALAADREAEP